jgi:hypothetical protein
MPFAAWIAFIAVIFAGLGGVVRQFAWRPIQQFLALRTEIRCRIAEFKNERARWKVTQYDADQPLRGVLSKAEEEERLRRAQIEFRDLAAQMRFFGEREHLATWILQRLQFDPIKVEAGLSDLADAIAHERAEHFAEISGYVGSDRAESV